MTTSVLFVKAIENANQIKGAFVEMHFLILIGFICSGVAKYITNRIDKDNRYQCTNTDKSGPHIFILHKKGLVLVRLLKLAICYYAIAYFSIEIVT